MHFVRWVVIQCAALSVMSAPLFANPANTELQPVKASVGIYVINIYDMDMTSNSFYADFYLWMKWKGPIDASKGISFSNLVEQGSFIINQLTGTDTLLSDGSKYRSFRIEGRFFNPFDVTNFPVDKQSLSLVLENELYESARLVYQVDASKSGIDKSVVVTGWNITGMESLTGIKSYNTDFGLNRIEEKESYATLTFKIGIDRPFNFFLWKLLFPLLIVLASGISFMFLEPSEFASRLNFPVFAMLTAVFMQMSYSSVIPETGYLVLMDRIYVAAYALIIENMIQVIVVYRMFVLDNNRLASLHRWDRVAASLSTIAFISYIVWIVSSVR